MGKLTVKKIEALTRAGLPGMTGDGLGLYFQISKVGGVSWIYRYRFNGNTRYMGLGAFPTVSLAQARELASEARKSQSRNTDPLEARASAREAQREAARRDNAQSRTFEMLAVEYCEAHGAGWSEKWRKGWLRKLQLYAFAEIGALPASEVCTEHVLKVLQPIWASKTRTADEVRGQIEQVLDAAKAHGLRDGENPARWRGHLENLLSKSEKKKARKRQHFAALEWRDVPELMSKLEVYATRDAIAARLLIITGARLHMVRLATWAEFDLESGVWSLPAERMKMRQAFSIPLAPESIKLLASLPKVESSPYLFPGRGESGVMHANGIRNLLHSLDYRDITRHGFRSSFRTWASECTNFPREICELALAHDERDQTEGAYSRSNFFEKRRKLMESWARFVSEKPENKQHLANKAVLV